jgi:hypothetical protein
VEPVSESVYEMCVHTYGCRVIQRVLEQSTESQIKSIMN